MRLRTAVKSAGSNAFYHSGALRLRGRLRGARSAPLVLGLHRVVENFQAASQGYMPSMLIDVDRFEKYLDLIGRRRRFVRLEEAAAPHDAAQAGGEPLAAVTFDDGYRDVYEHAFPLLRRKGIPFTVFVVTDLVGTDRLLAHDELFLLLSQVVSEWGTQGRGRLTELLDELGLARNVPIEKYDPFSLTRTLLVALPQKELLRIIAALHDMAGPVKDANSHRLASWEMLEEMHAAGATIGSHTATHPLLTKETREKIAFEVSASKLEIEARIGGNATCFAYPDGAFNPEVVSALAQAGYEIACTVCGHRDPGYPKLTAPRRMLWQNAATNARGRPSPAVLECLLDGIFDKATKCQEHEK